MKIGIHFSYWAEDWIEDYHKYIDKAANLGFDILEISCSGLSALYANESELLCLKQHAEQRNLCLTAGYGPSPTQNLCSSDKNIIKSSISFYQKILPMLHVLDIKILAGPLYSSGSIDFFQEIDIPSIWERTQENLLRVAEIAEQSNVTLALEVVNRYEGYLLNTCEEALRFVSELNNSHIQILLDTFHMNIEETSLCNAIIQAGDKLKHLHISEQNRRLPGQGSLSWEDISGALDTINYDGAIVIESFVRSSGNIGRKAMIWKDLISDPTEKQLDREAKNSLSFLRNVFSQTE